MTPAELLKDAFTRVVESAESVVDGLTDDQLAARPGPQANSIAWLVWHLARVQDDHVADVAGTTQVWISDGWAGRFGLPLEIQDHGFGHTPQQVAQVVVDAEMLGWYHDAVHARTVAYVQDLRDVDLERVIDRRWDPPVTLAVRLVSVVDDCAQHVGQAAFVRGILERR